MPTDSARSHQPKITLYTTPACYWCRTAKRYLEDRGLTFEEVNVAEDRRAHQQMVRMTGQNGVPVIRVGDSAMTGWDKAEFERLLTLGPRRR